MLILHPSACTALAQVFAGLLVGAMLPYWFSAMTMKSVGKAALSMVEEVRHWHCLGYCFTLLGMLLPTAGLPAPR